MVQRFSETDTAVIRRARRKRRDVLVLREDAGWLSEFSRNPRNMLSRMAARGALIRLGAGRYAIPDIGSASLAYKSWQPLLHARLAPMGNYYLGGFSALEEHRLTDLTESAAFVFGAASMRSLGTFVEIAGRPTHLKLTGRDVFAPELGIETVRLSRSEAYLRSTLTRTLVDCLWQPGMCGAVETWVTAWGRGAVDALEPETACRQALVMGPSVARRVGLMLELVGMGDVARKCLAPRDLRGSRATLLVAGLHDASTRTGEIDRDWGVRFNVPRHQIEGWLTYGK